jgi:hypothetical protein
VAASGDSSTRPKGAEDTVIVLGIILLIVGFLAEIAIVWTLGLSRSCSVQHWPSPAAGGQSVADAATGERPPVSWADR